MGESSVGVNTIGEVWIGYSLSRPIPQYFHKYVDTESQIPNSDVDQAVLETHVVTQAISNW